jgi:hypothetical protein
MRNIPPGGDRGRSLKKARGPVTHAGNLPRMETFATNEMSGTRQKEPIGPTIGLKRGPLALGEKNGAPVVFGSSQQSPA